MPSSVPRNFGCAAALMLLGLGLPSCNLRGPQSSWLNPRPADVRSSRWTELPAQRFREVAEQARAEAIRLLQTDAVQRLPGRDVQRFVTGDVFNQPQGRFYLLRAVAVRGGNCTLQLLTSGRTVTVSHACLSKAGDAIQTAVVADLQQPPETVYVELTIAE